MKKKTILFIAFIMVAGWAHAQGSISNIQVEERADDLRVVDILFDLAGGGAEYNILLEVSFNGEEFEAIDPDNITGSVSNVAPATNIQLVWDGSINFQNVSVNDARIKITATHVCETDFTFTYRGSSVTYGTVLVDYSGTVGKKCWMDRNLGAEPMPFDPVGTTTNTTEELYGDLFQWGRGDDGHQVVDWTVSPPNVTPTTTTLSTTDDPGHGEFITVSSLPWDWRSTQNNALWQGEDGINNPCPPGWRMPTKEELDAEREDWTEGNNSYGAYESALKWPVGGYRGYNGTLYNVGSHGRVWSSLVIGDYPSTLYFNSGNSFISSPTSKAFGFSVRCVRDN